MTSKVLLTVATRWEAAPLVAALGLASVGPNRYAGRCGRQEILAVQTGMGAAKTVRALDSAVDAREFSLALSIGLCGSLQAEVQARDLVFDTGEAASQRDVALGATAAELGLTCHLGRILHADRVLHGPDKRELGALHGALACDMETSAVRTWAAGRMPVLGARVVLDEVGETLPTEAPSGESPVALARFAVLHAASLPRLFALGWRSARAMAVLNRFLKAYLQSL